MSQQPFQTLNLEIPKNIFVDYSFDSISSFFKQNNMPTLRWLIYETNPLDICSEIYRETFAFTKEVQILKKYISKNMLESIIYGLIISDPPENIMGIARLLIKWNNIYVVEELEEIRSIFIKAVSRVQMVEL